MAFCSISSLCTCNTSHIAYIFFCFQSEKWSLLLWKRFILVFDCSFHDMCSRVQFVIVWSDSFTFRYVFVVNKYIFAIKSSPALQKVKALQSTRLPMKLSLYVIVFLISWTTGIYKIEISLMNTKMKSILLFVFFLLHICIPVRYCFFFIKNG